MDPDISKLLIRLKTGDHPALLDLIQALKDRKDGRGDIIEDRMEAVLTAIVNRREEKPDDHRFLVTAWQHLNLFAINLFTPTSQLILERSRNL